MSGATLNDSTVQKDLHDIASVYLNDSLDYEQLSDTTTAYKGLLGKLYDQELDSETGRNDVFFENGKALGTFWAALCLDDIIRTRSFIRGIDKAIDHKLKDQKPLHILYAGTGPYATLLLPLMAKYADREIRYTFMEINSFSLNILKQVINSTFLKEFDITYLQEDASMYRIDQENLPDIIISETMQRALEKEQQVPIFLNLMDQAREDTVFIPEKVRLMVGTVDDHFSYDDPKVEDFHEAGTLFEVSKESLLPVKQWVDQKTGDFKFLNNITKVSAEQLKGARQLFLLTEIQTYADEFIKANESGLTIPVYLKAIKGSESGDLLIESQYQVSKIPGLEYSIRFSEKNSFKNPKDHRPETI